MKVMSVLMVAQAAVPRGHVEGIELFSLVTVVAALGLLHGDSLRSLGWQGWEEGVRCPCMYESHHCLL